MRTRALVVTVLLASGCAAAPGQNQFTAPVGTGQALSCVNTQIANRAYQATGGGPTSNFIRAERVNDEPFWLNIIGLNDSVDVIDATIVGSQLRVSAFSQVVRGDERLASTPSEEARRDAQAILQACGDD